MAGLAKPNLDELHPELDFALRKRATGTFDAHGAAPVAEGRFTAQIQWQDVRFKQPATGRYLCLEALSSLDGKPFAAVAELDAPGRPNGTCFPNPGGKSRWVSSEETTDEAENILDGQPATFWHTDYSHAKPIIRTDWSSTSASARPSAASATSRGVAAPAIRDGSRITACT